MIRGNLIEEVPGDGIVPIGCDSTLIEYNVMRDCPDMPVSYTHLGHRDGEDRTAENGGNQSC